MAKQTTVTLVDDIDGGEADEHLEFSFEGRSYEIDLSAKNGGKLRDVLAPYIAAGRRRTGRGTTSTTASTARPSVDRELNQAIREWAQQQDMKIAERGRIPSHVLEAYHRAH